MVTKQNACLVQDSRSLLDSSNGDCKVKYSSEWLSQGQYPGTISRDFFYNHLCLESPYIIQSKLKCHKLPPFKKKKSILVNSAGISFNRSSRIDAYKIFFFHRSNQQFSEGLTHNNHISLKVVREEGAGNREKKMIPKSWQTQ
jgi:hypothetical protein